MKRTKMFKKLAMQEKIKENKEIRRNCRKHEYVKRKINQEIR